MPFTVYRIERDKSETVIGYADNPFDATAIMTADRDSIDWEAGYHWQNDGGKNEPKSNDT